MIKLFNQIVIKYKFLMIDNIINNNNNNNNNNYNNNNNKQLYKKSRWVVL